MARKRKFIVSRQTWQSQQFEFSVPASYQECLKRLQYLQTDLQAERSSRSGFQRTLKFELDDDTTASFRIILENVIVTGTILQLTDESTLFVGISQFDESFLVLVIMFSVVGLAVAILPFLSAYVSAVPDAVWSTNTIRTSLSALLIFIGGMLLFYFMYRWQVWRAVRRLASAVDY